MQLMIKVMQVCNSDYENTQSAYISAPAKDGGHGFDFKLYKDRIIAEMLAHDRINIGQLGQDHSSNLDDMMAEDKKSQIVE